MLMPRILAPTLVAVGLAGCISLPPPASDELVKVEAAIADSHPVFSGAITGAVGGIDRSEQRARTAQLLQQPLSLYELQELWLLNSPQLAAELAELGVTRAQYAQAGLISNPTLAIAALRPEGGGRWQWELGISQSLLDLLTRPLRVQLAESTLVAAQLTLYDALNQHLFTLQHQYLAAVTARQLRQLQEARLEGAQASLALAESLYQAGNMAEADWLIYRLALQEEQRALAQSVLVIQEEDIKLKYLVGLPAADLSLPDALPPLPAAGEWNLDQLITEALAHRADVLLARTQARTSLRQQNLTSKYPGMDTLEMGAQFERESDGGKKVGPELAFSLPVFDRGKVRALAAESAVARDQALVRTRELQVAAEIAAALAALNHAHLRLTSIQEESLPLSRQLQALRLREYNYMLTSPFVLLELKQKEFSLQQEAILALRDYWQAFSDLSRAHGRSLGPLPPSDGPAANSPTSENPHSDHYHGEHHHD